MQTFLPFPDFAQSASVLDRQRLGKQRVETLQLLSALSPTAQSGWRNHPAARMWRGFSPALALYGITICDEWIARGYRDTCREKILPFSTGELSMPPWLGREAFHASHRSNLLRKAPSHYSQFNWSESPDLPYIWPGA